MIKGSIKQIKLGLWPNVYVIRLLNLIIIKAAVQTWTYLCDVVFTAAHVFRHRHLSTLLLSCYHQGYIANFISVQLMVTQTFHNSTVSWCNKVLFIGVLSVHVGIKSLPENWKLTKNNVPPNTQRQPRLMNYWIINPFSKHTSVT